MSDSNCKADICQTPVTGSYRRRTYRPKDFSLPSFHEVLTVFSVVSVEIQDTVLQGPNGRHNT